jgi:hypothetical protein
MENWAPLPPPQLSGSVGTHEQVDPNAYQAQQFGQGQQFGYQVQLAPTVAPVQLQPLKTPGKMMSRVVVFLTVLALGGFGFVAYSLKYKTKNYNDVVAAPYQAPTTLWQPALGFDQPTDGAAPANPNVATLPVAAAELVPPTSADPSEWDITAPIADDNRMCLKTTNAGYQATACRNQIVVELVVSIPSTTSTNNQVSPEDEASCVTAISTVLGRPFRANTVATLWTMPHEMGGGRVRCGYHTLDVRHPVDAKTFRAQLVAALDAP